MNVFRFAPTLCLTALLLLLALPMSAQAEGDPVGGRTKAFTCMGCHGAPGYRNAYPAYLVPKLGGQHREYLVVALKAYRSGERRHPTMRGHTATLSDQDMEDIAAYFASLETRARP